MDKLVLYQIDEELGSSEVEQLCFLCSDVIKRRSLEKVKDAKALFTILEEKGLLDNSAFLCQLLETIHRVDLLRKLQSNTSSQVETDAVPILSTYRVMLYDIYEDITKDNLDRMKFLLTEKLGKRKLEISKTALDVFTEMEKMEIMSKTNVDELHRVLQQFDQKLAMTVWNYMQGLQQPLQQIRPHVSMDQQELNDIATLPPQSFLSIADTQPSCGGESIYSDANPETGLSSLTDEKEKFFRTSNPQFVTSHQQMVHFETMCKNPNGCKQEDDISQNKEDIYHLQSQPVGLCVIINNENFHDGTQRSGTEKDAQSLAEVFSWLGFTVLMCEDQTKDEMEQTMTYFASLTDLMPSQNFNVQEWSASRFVPLERVPRHGDAFICCILSHGQNGAVLGIDRNPLYIKKITSTFKGTWQSPLTGKPKVFLIQACQGLRKQQGVLLKDLETDDSGLLCIPKEADVLVAVATVEDHVSYRHRTNGSWFIQSVCQQLKEHCPRGKDILTILSYVNNEVSQKEAGNFPGDEKQMPEVRFNLRKRLVLSPPHKSN